MPLFNTTLKSLISVVSFNVFAHMSEQKCTGHCKIRKPAAFLSEEAHLVWSRVWKNLTFSGVVNKITGLLQPSIKEEDLNPSTKFNHGQDFFSIEVIDSG